MQHYNASIVTIGDEILIGQIIDSNSAWLADKLFHAGFTITEIRSISDTPNQIKKTLSELSTKNQLIVLTGGLGPTSDDRTKSVLNDFFEGTFITNEEVLSDIKEFVKKRKGSVQLTDNNRAQALVSNNAQVLRNAIGTAPCQVFTKNSCTVVSLPGVPFEMKHLFEHRVIQLLQKQFALTTNSYKTYHVVGFAESKLSNTLTNWESKLPETVSIAYLPSPGVIRLRISETNGNQKLLEPYTEELKEIIGKNIVAEGKEKVEITLGKTCKNKQLTIAIAESCTGGLIAHKLTSIPGSSEYFMGSVTAYSNAAKIALLKVNASIIEKHGAVSEYVAREMAIGAANAFKTKVAIATTGIAGPDGGTPEKPVGTVWIAVYYHGEVHAHLFNFTHNRQINIERAATTAMYKTLEMILYQS